MYISIPVVAAVIFVFVILVALAMVAGRFIAISREIGARKQAFENAQDLFQKYIKPGYFRGQLEDEFNGASAYTLSCEIMILLGRAHKTPLDLLSILDIRIPGKDRGNANDCGRNFILRVIAENLNEARQMFLDQYFKITANMSYQDWKDRLKSLKIANTWVDEPMISDLRLGFKPFDADTSYDYNDTILKGLEETL